MTNRFTSSARKATDLTNQQLADEISKLNHFKDLEKLLPSVNDREEFIKLMNEVKKETDNDNKILYLQNNLKTAGSVVFKVLRMFI